MNNTSYIKKLKNDRVSSILISICLLLSMITMENKSLESLYEILGLIILVSTATWMFIILPKIKNPTKLSKIDKIIIFAVNTLFFLFLCLKLSIPQMFPAWTDTAILLILFATLTYFALSNRTSAKGMQ